jgi:hypothetical protein
MKAKPVFVMEEASTSRKETCRRERKKRVYNSIIYVEVENNTT